MEPVRIYYESGDSEHDSGELSAVTNKNRKNDSEKLWHLEPREHDAHSHFQKTEKIPLFPEENYGEYQGDLREIEKRYSEDRISFFSLNYREPELVPAAEQLLDTLSELMSAARIVFDRFGTKPELQDCALEIMNRICKDSYAAGEEISDHVKMMLEKFPDDDVLRGDLREIDESFTDFYLESYSVMVKYRKRVKRQI